jgi:2-polyprenyl-3-methyl-5-hydroxy-6-metoxy-1,4-benzoquinol methylase
MKHVVLPTILPMKERQPRLSALAGVDDAVRIFYNLHPYPPPVDSLDGYRRLWNDRNRRRADSHLLWPSLPDRDRRNILVAGCGTSQAAKYAIRHPAARVTGIDLSEESANHTRELKQRYNLSNLHVRQLPIEHAGRLGDRFDQIVCTGVLHHLPNPEAGLLALRELLAPQGVMHVMVYAAYGRAGIYMIQEYCRRLGIGESEEEIRDLAATLQALPPGHPVECVLREAADFQRPEALADAFLHPRDRAYTVPQFFNLIERCGMAFGRWLRQAPYLPQCGTAAKTPHFARLVRLPLKEQYAAIELFRGTMLRHSAILRRDDEPAGAGAIRFDGEDWLGYRPIRLPATIAIRERLPAGAAAVLVNRLHTCLDIYLPIDAEQLRWLEQIDGHRTIAEITHNPSASPNGEQRLLRARDFFERLWQYDQVVFDSSQSPAQPPAGELA